MKDYSISVRSDPKDIRVCSSCELKEIADWLRASHEEDDQKTKIVISRGRKRVVSIVVLRVLPNTINVFIAREGTVLDTPITLTDVNKFIFQKLTVAGVNEQGEIRQVLISNKRGALIILDDSGHIAVSC